MINSTLSLLEALWVFVALIGAGAHIVGMLDAIADLQNLRAAGLNGARILTARMHLRNEVVRLAGQILFAVVGTRAAVLPAGADVVAIQIVFIFVATSLTLMSLLDRRTRHRLLGIGLLEAVELEEIRERAEEDPVPQRKSEDTQPIPPVEEP